MLFSLLVLYGEIAYFFQLDFKFFDTIVSFDGGFIISNFLVIFVFGYFMLTVYFGLFSFKLTSWYELYPKHTDPGSMIWSATLLARLIYPPCFNFLEISQI